MARYILLIATIFIIKVIQLIFKKKNDTYYRIHLSKYIYILFITVGWNADFYFTFYVPSMDRCHRLFL